MGDIDGAAAGGGAAALAALRTPAPAGFAERVLARLELLDTYALLPGPGGRSLGVAVGPRGVTYVLATDSAAEFEARFARRFGRPLRQVDRLPASVATALRSGSAARRVPVDLGGLSPFERDVLTKAREIPPGEVRSYGWVAREIGRPGAVRAVGSALGRNPVPVLIPCHRVVRSDGRVGNYAFGPAMKRDLLVAEGVDVGEVERRAAAGLHFLGSDTTRVFCVPTCRDARRITPPHAVQFRTAAAARAAGYRPCRRCRPAPDSPAALTR